jgi:hypothetical protein
MDCEIICWLGIIWCNLMTTFIVIICRTMNESERMIELFINFFYHRKFSWNYFCLLKWKRIQKLMCMTLSNADKPKQSKKIFPNSVNKGLLTEFGNFFCQIFCWHGQKMKKFFGEFFQKFQSLISRLLQPSN